MIIKSRFKYFTYATNATNWDVTGLIPLGKYSISPHPLSAGGDNLQPQILERVDQKKRSAWGVLASPCQKYLPGGAYYASLQKGFELRMHSCIRVPRIRLAYYGLVG